MLRQQGVSGLHMSSVRALEMIFGYNKSNCNIEYNIFTSSCYKYLFMVDKDKQLTCLKVCLGKFILKFHFCQNNCRVYRTCPHSFRYFSNQRSYLQLLVITIVSMIPYMLIVVLFSDSLIQMKTSPKLVLTKGLQAYSALLVVPQCQVSNKHVIYWSNTVVGSIEFLEQTFN